jgi:Cdc6-like AAA superfamily ATPase
MYLCGHPGTGKTSLLNQVIARLNHDENVRKFELFQYNAMTYNDVRSFGLTLLQDINERVTGEKRERLQRHKVDDESLADLIVRALASIKDHKIIVIDEVDQFNSSERSFTILVKAVLTSTKTNACNTSIMGIANSVDLPFKKKHSAIAMRDCQLLFRPYDCDSLMEILETKKNKLFSRLPPKMKTDQIKAIYHGIIDQKVYEFIAKKVSNLNGDIRAAFDMMRNTLNSYAEELRSSPEMPSSVKITINHILKLHE